MPIVAIAPRYRLTGNSPYAGLMAFDTIWINGETFTQTEEWLSRKIEISK
ncbi:hypothetical protein [Paramesorhizobium deserti]|nr:hypothetical protein [Paramesorhizobium deserti]